LSKSWPKRKKSSQKIVKKEKKFSESCQKVIKKLSKSCQKVVKKLSKSCQKVVKKLSKKLLKSCQKVVKKVVKKLSKSCKKLTKRSAMYHWYMVILCDTGSHFKEKINKRGGWGGWVGGQIVVPRPSASASLTGRRQKRAKRFWIQHAFVMLKPLSRWAPYFFPVGYSIYRNVNVNNEEGNPYFASI
jgi:hypothetical protein